MPGLGERSHLPTFDKAPAHLQHSVRRPMGYMVSTGPVGVEDEGETTMCVHCQMHWKVQPGSGRKRGFCFNCNGLTCGKESCETRCVPFEKAIEEMEAKGRLEAALQRNKQL